MNKQQLITLKPGILRELRSESGKNQTEVADYLGVSRGAYQHLEAKGILSAEELANLCVYYKVPIHKFYNTTMLRQENFSIFGKAILAEEEEKVLELFSSLTPEQKKRALGYLKGLSLSEI